MHDDEQRALFAKNLNARMGAQGRTQADVMRAMNVGRATVSEWCRGTKLPRIEKLAELANWLGVSNAWLMGWEEEPAYDPAPNLPEFHTRGEYLTQSTGLTLGDFVRKRRTCLGITQQRVADLLGYTDRNSVANLEAGKIDLPVSRIPYLAKALQCPPEVLIPDEDGMLHPWREK